MYVCACVFVCVFVLVSYIVYRKNTIPCGGKIVHFVSPEILVVNKSVRLLKNQCLRSRLKIFLHTFYHLRI